LKIAVIRRECGYSWGGAERYCAHAVRELARLGHKVTVVCSEADHLPGGVERLAIPLNVRGSILKNHLFNARVARALEGRKFDVVYGVSRVYPVDFFRVSERLHSEWMARRYPNALIRSTLSKMPRHALILRLERKLMADERVRIVANSRLVADQVRKWYGTAESRIHVVYNGVDHALFNPRLGEDAAQLKERLCAGGEKLLVFSAMHLWSKGFDLLVEALEQLDRDDFRLVVMGAEKGDKAAVAPAAVLRNIEWVGRVDNPQHHYAAADLMVLPTRYDPFANVCLEAMACGTPVLTTDMNGAAELIEDGVNGFVVSSEDVEGLRGALVRFLDAPIEERAEMGRRAAKTAREYTYERHAEALVELFSTALG